LKELLRRAQEDFERTRRPTPPRCFAMEIKSHPQRLAAWKVHRELMAARLRYVERLAGAVGIK
jgi:hypothetical protein